MLVYMHTHTETMGAERSLVDNNNNYTDTRNVSIANNFFVKIIFPNFELKMLGFINSTMLFPIM